MTKIQSLKTKKISAIALAGTFSLFFLTGCPGKGPAFKAAKNVGGEVAEEAGERLAKVAGREAGSTAASQTLRNVPPLEQQMLNDVGKRFGPGVRTKVEKALPGIICSVYATGAKQSYKQVHNLFTQKMYDALGKEPSEQIDFIDFYIKERMKRELGNSAKQICLSQ